MRVSQVETLAAEGRGLAVGQQVGFLHHVLGLGIVPEDAARSAVQALVVGAHEQLERTRRAGHYQRHQFRPARRGHARLAHCSPPQRITSVARIVRCSVHR